MAVRRESRRGSVQGAVRRSGQSLTATPASGRDAANLALAGMAERFPDLLPGELHTDGLDAREASLAHAIVDAASRRWLTLSWLIEKASGRRMADLEPGIAGVLLSAAAQLLLLDRLPPHAVLNESVGWTKRAVRAKASGLVNAVLRRVSELVPEDGGHRASWTGAGDELPLSDGTALGLSRAILPENERARFRVAVSMPDRIINAWRNAFGEDEARRLALHGLTRAPVIATGEGGEGVEGLLPHDEPGHRVVERGVNVGKLLAAHPGLWVQDPGASASLRLVVPWLGDTSPRLIVDVCAGRGTKTRQARTMFPDAEIIAAEVDDARLADLRAVGERLGGVRVCHASELGSVCSRAADLVILDVPCSNSGVLARRPEARYRFGAAQTARLVETQTAIIEQGVALARPAGHVLYATCSLERAENDAAVERACARHGLERVASKLTLPSGLPGEPATRYRDGGFAALLAVP